MRDEAVASQDQDPTTEGVPAGQTPDGRGTGPSDASETIVSGKAAEGSREDDPAEHDAWDAEFAGLAGTTPETEVSAGKPDEAAEAASADTSTDRADAQTPGTPGTGAAHPAPEPPQSKARPGREEVPGGHPSLAQRSTLPMRAASIMPDLSRYGTDGTPAEHAAAPVDASAADETGADKEAAANTRPAAGAPDDAVPGDAPHPTAAAGGPWYGPGTAEQPVTGQPDTSEPETRQPADTDPAISTEEAARRSAERERAAAAKPVLGRIIQVAIAVFFPVMLLAAAIRAVATPVFLWIEYNRPGFPADSFGFSTDDRMTYGSYAVDYLLNFASPRYLGDLVTPDGDPLYLASEVSHMADVKTVLTLAFLTALGMALLSLAGGLYLARRCPGGIRRALFAGAVATLAIIAGLLVAAVLAWEEFFTLVHSIFFAQGNWTFRLDDTLIRLFPAQFWMDAGAAIAGIVLLVCLLVMVFTWPTKKRRERSRLAREESRRRYLESLEAL
ncbi:lipoprotein intramolecular transacylase Lit [Arthrobacter sp. NPDC055585]